MAENTRTQTNRQPHDAIALRRELRLRRYGIMLGISFAVYCFFLIWIILFKLEVPSLWHTLDRGMRSLNTVPFKGLTLQRLRLNNEFISNILAFIPFGFFIQIMFRKLFLPLQLLLPLLLSLFLETLQYFFRIGVADINDLIANTAGGWIGILLAALVWLAFKEKSRVYRMVVWPLVICGSLMVVWLLFLSYYNS